MAEIRETRKIKFSPSKHEFHFGSQIKELHRIEMRRLNLEPLHTLRTTRMIPDLVYQIIRKKKYFFKKLLEKKRIEKFFNFQDSFDGFNQIAQAKCFIPS